MTISRYDHSNKGELSIKEWFNVLRIQNHIDTSMDMVRTRDLDHILSIESKYLLSQIISTYYLR